MTTWAQPTVHLNGTSKESLLNGYRVAMAAVRLAINAVQSTAPHGRDYYVQKDNPLQAAITEHSKRLQVLEHVYNELETLAQHVMEQGK
jgi:hypothetical protein